MKESYDGREEGTGNLLKGGGGALLLKSKKKERHRYCWHGKEKKTRDCAQKKEGENARLYASIHRRKQIPIGAEKDG